MALIRPINKLDKSKAGFRLRLEALKLGKNPYFTPFTQAMEVFIKDLLDISAEEEFEIGFGQ
jgi:hypothetical protein